MSKLFFLTIFIFTSCAPKEQLTVFDSNMIGRSTAECEDAAKEIENIKNQCQKNNQEIKNIITKME